MKNLRYTHSLTLLIIVAVFLTVLFYIKPEAGISGITGRVILGTQYLNLEFSEDSSLTWTLGVLGELESVKLTGRISGAGNAKVYLYDLLIINQDVCGCYDNINSITGEYTGRRPARYVRIYHKETYEWNNETWSRWVFKDRVELVDGLFTTSMIADGEMKFTAANNQAILNISCPQSLCPGEINDAFTIDSLDVEFKDECVDTCQLDPGYIGDEFTLNVDITGMPDAILYLDSITYTLYETTNSAPEVNITSPANGSEFYENDSINFSGIATDAEDINSILIVNWSSNVNGSLNTAPPDENGTVGFLTNSTNMLTVGQHIITLTATDPAEASGNDSIVIMIKEIPPPEPENTTNQTGNQTESPETNVTDTGGGEINSGEGSGSSRISEEEQEETEIELFKEEKHPDETVQAPSEDTSPTEPAEPAYCNDGEMNEDEEGTDCGGSCLTTCTFMALSPTGKVTHIGKTILSKRNPILLAILAILVIVVIIKKSGINFGKNKIINVFKRK